MQLMSYLTSAIEFAESMQVIEPGWFGGVILFFAGYVVVAMTDKSWKWKIDALEVEELFYHALVAGAEVQLSARRITAESYKKWIVSNNPIGPISWD